MPATQDFTNFATEHPNFFPGQFLLEDDFELQHKYLGDRQKYHNQSLQVSGILEGLEVTPITDKKEVKIAAGTAIDSAGNLIVLKNEVTFGTFGELTKGELYLEFVQTKTNKQQEEIAESFTRWTETVAIAVAKKAPTGSIPLCIYETIGDDEVKVDSSLSQYSGVYLPNPKNHDLSLRSGGVNNPDLAILSGKLKVTGDAETAGSHTVGGDLNITKKVAIQHVSQDANGDALMIGSTLRLGHNLQYGWVQSHNNKPLAINPIANNVGIGTTTPGNYKLNVEGDQYISKTLTVAGYFKSQGNNAGERVLLTEAPLNENHRGDGVTQSKTGLALRVATNPASGDPIFQVQSSGQAVRFFVDHDGWTGAKDNSAWFGGANKNYFKSQLVIASTSDAALGTANSGALIIGNSAAAHLAIDNNEIIAKNNGTTAGTLNFQTEGGATSIGGSLTIKEQLDLLGNKKIVFSNTDVTNNLKLQLWSGYGLGINSETLFYAANGIHSWRDNNGTNERMKLTTKADGGLQVKGTGNSSFVGRLKVAGNWVTTSAENSLKMLRGLIKPDGGIYSGSGFSSRKISTGLYEITFSSAFSDHPAIIATQDYPANVNASGSQTGNTKDNAVVVGISPSKCRIKCGNGDGGATNRYFSFLAIGLR